MLSRSMLQQLSNETSAAPGGFRGAVRLLTGREPCGTACAAITTGGGAVPAADVTACSTSVAKEKEPAGGEGGRGPAARWRARRNRESAERAPLATSPRCAPVRCAALASAGRGTALDLTARPMALVCSDVADVSSARQRHARAATGRHHSADTRGSEEPASLLPILASFERGPRLRSHAHVSASVCPLLPPWRWTRCRRSRPRAPRTTTTWPSSSTARRSPSPAARRASRTSRPAYPGARAVCCSAATAQACDPFRFRRAHSNAGRMRPRRLCKCASAERRSLGRLAANACERTQARRRC